jgi:hypothetical protein
MSSLKDKIAAEVKVRQLIESEGLPDPDEVEYGHACIRLLWNESKVCLIVDLEDQPNPADVDLSSPYP